MGKGFHMTQSLAGHLGQVRKGWFAIRVVNPWNSLPSNVVNAPSIATFKTKLDEFLMF